MDNSKIILLCDECSKQYNMRIRTSIKNYIKYGNKNVCFSCICKKRNLPQHTKDYWKNESVKKKHSESIKSSQKYYDAIKERNTSGSNNSMFGKTHSSLTKQKMSISRTGKIRENATGWKGGKASLNSLIKGHIHRVHKWYFNVYKRDGFKCTKCGSKDKIDAHHVISINYLIKTIIKEKNIFNLSKYEIFDLIKEDERLVDKNLNNGITLCRTCHKKEHAKKWGSHNA